MKRAIWQQVEDSMLVHIPTDENIEATWCGLPRAPNTAWVRSASCIQCIENELRVGVGGMQSNRIWLRGRLAELTGNK